MLEENNQSIEQEINDESATLELDAVDISDKTLENDDNVHKNAKKQAKKHAKKLLTPEEKKKRRIKQLIIGAATTLAVVVILLIIPITRWPLLNIIGFRGDLVITVLSDASNKPVKNAEVKLNDKTLLISDEFGKVTFKNARLGKQQISIEKSGYGQEVLQVINKTGTTKQNAALKVIGIKLDFDIKNWLTNSPIEGAVATFNEESGTSDKTGRATIVIPPTDQASVEVQISAPGYATKTIEAELAVAVREVTLVSNQKNYFISRRDGKFDIFSSNLDGSDQKKIIEATGKELSEVLQFSINKTNKQAILVANRDGKVVSGRYVAGIYLIDLEKASIKKIDEGSDVQLLDWFDSTISYTKTNQNAVYNDPHFTELKIFNTGTGKLSTAASANYFATALMAQSKLFYVAADPYREVEDGALTSYDVQTAAKKTYLAGVNVQLASRASYQTLDILDTSNNSYELQISQGSTRSVDRKNITGLTFSMSPNSQQTAWYDQRDGQGTVLIKNIKNNDEKIIVKAGGLTHPIRFVSDDLLVVRVVTSQETADYVVSISTGKMAKIVDVSNIGATLRQSL